MTNHISSCAWPPQALVDEDDAENCLFKPYSGCYTHRFLAWPYHPHLYSCTYCERQFRCGQALGGHMKAHRRDRDLLCLFSHSSNITLSPKRPPPITTARPSINTKHCSNPSSTILGSSSSSYNHSCNTKTSPSFQKSAQYTADFLQTSSFSTQFNQLGYARSRQELLIPTDEVDLELRLGYNSST